jgi:hypothetical protein
MAEPDKSSVTLEELLVSRAAGCTSEALDREGANYPRRVYSEDFRGAGDVSEFDY